jgi:hypothetical protein
MKTTLTLEKDTLNNLTLIKIATGLPTLDEVINKLILNYQVQKAKGEQEHERE